jgi:DNA-directed RNA polymerase specialized sigma24 family protein
MSRTEHPTDSPFPTTRWTLVRMADREGDESASAALESLCRDYWAPLHAFARHFGQSESDAADTVQDFLSGFVASGGFAKASRPKGRLRTYLLGSLRHFMTDQWRRSQALKRAVERGSVSLDALSGRLVIEDRTDHEAGIAVYDREWAKRVMDRTLSAMREAYAKRGKEPLFDRLLPMAEGRELAGGDREALCAELGFGSNTLSAEMLRFRNRLARGLRETIRDTVADEGEIEDELRYLAKVLAG